jgi:hypothetical protein
MNERIRELAKLADSGYTGNSEDGLGASLVGNHAIEKFAELLIRECVEQIISKGTDWVDFAPSQTGVRPEYWDMAQQIKQHFGVEE